MTADVELSRETDLSTLVNRWWRTAAGLEVLIEHAFHGQGFTGTGHVATTRDGSRTALGLRYGDRLTPIE